MAEQPRKQPTEQTLANWEKDVRVLEEAVRLMLDNRLADAERTLEEASREVAARDIDFQGGGHDLRGAFTLVSAFMGLLNGLASLQNDQLDTVLERIWVADDLLAKDGDWAGKTVLRGLCLLVAGVVQLMQGQVTRGMWHVLRSWLWLRYLESEGLNFEGHERACVRSTALLALGVFNLFASMLPPKAMSAAGWFTGFKGGRETALGQLRTCWEEGGIQAPFAGMVLIGIAVDVSSFLGELWEQREKKHADARKILDWAAERYPGAFFFNGLEVNYLAATRELPRAVEKLHAMRPSVDNLPAFQFIVHARTATLEASQFHWAEAGEAFSAAVRVHRDVGRRATCPSLALNSHLCYVLAEDTVKAAEMLELARSYRHESKKWQRMDVYSLGQAELAHAAAEGRAVTGDKWRPRLILYTKICVIYRAVNFMQPDMVQRFLDAVRKETEACTDDVDGRCIGFFIQAEALRQTENWDEALKAASAALALEPQLSSKGAKSGALQFSHLVTAYAQFALGNLAAAKDALTKLSALNAAHFFQRQVEFKATHLRRLLGAEIQDIYASVTVPARGKVRLVAEVPEGTESVEWDWLVADYTVSFIAFYKATDGERVELQRAEQHQSSAGPVTGCHENPPPGQLELVFDNAFSRMRGKTIQYRVQPSSLVVRQETEP